MSDENKPWWEHALNALTAGYALSEQKRKTTDAQTQADLEARRRARAKGRPERTSAGFDELMAKPRRRVKLPDEPCCDGPRRK